MNAANILVIFLLLLASGTYVLVKPKTVIVVDASPDSPNPVETNPANKPYIQKEEETEKIEPIA